MLEQSWGQVSENMKSNQYGGQRQCGTEHFLALLWTGMLDNLEDSRGCNSFISLDFAKAFDRLDHSHIFHSYARLGASTQVIRLLAGFLSGRTMRVKVSGVLSSPGQSMAVHRRDLARGFRCTRSVLIILTEASQNPPCLEREILQPTRSGPSFVVIRELLNIP